MSLVRTPWYLRTAGAIALLGLLGAERPYTRSSYGVPPAPRTTSSNARPSYEITVESIPEWAEEVEEPEIAESTVEYREEPVHQPSQRTVRKVMAPRPAANQDYHETNFRGRRSEVRVYEAPEPVWHETMPQRVSVGPNGESIIYQGPEVTVSDPLYSEANPVSDVDGLSRQVMEPVEVLEGEEPEMGCTTGECQSCGDGGICDLVYRSKGCDRHPCPCPTDEVLSYYRCNHYGYYPTFWRPWPDGWLKYRPEVADTIYDRYRKTAAGVVEPGLEPNRQGGDPDLDRELQEMLRTSPSPQPRTPGAQPRRRPPELLPEESGAEPPRNPAAPKAPPPKLDQSSARARRLSVGTWFNSQDRTNANREVTDEVQQTSYEGRAPRTPTKGKSVLPLKVSRRQPSRQDF